MKFMFIGHFMMGGSGYTKILERVARGLVDRGHEVKIYGIGYDKSTHYHPFSVIPIDHTWILEILRFIPEEYKPDRIIIAEDVHRLHEMVKALRKSGEESLMWKVEAIFPVESIPVLPSWVETLGLFKSRYVISKFGTQAIQSNGLEAVHLPMGCDVTAMPKSKNGPRKLLKWPQHKTIFLTVASNQERKALPLAIQAMTCMPKDVEYVIVTDLEGTTGWKLEELRDEYKLQGRLHLINRGLDIGTLSTMYWAADALINTSQAEGACLPVYEAAMHGLPVICGNWTALSDVADERWVINVDHEFTYRNVWGNVWRWGMSPDDLASKMHEFHTASKEDKNSMSITALQYAASHSWEPAISLLEKGLE